ncbi:MAG TPA: carotenoid oxygenase family protein [Pseudomonadales bacterium]|nr:carotenoid oxygenase family protein [Pseudomonadales bacterium]
MAAPYPNDPLLRGPFEPIRFEADCANLVVDGELPADLAGALYRIGPNPQFAPRGRYNPLQGDGMVHAFFVNRGRVAYRNRWVRTRQWRLERAAGRALFATSGDPRDADPAIAGQATDGVANTHIVAHAGRLLALEEGHGRCAALTRCIDLSACATLVATPRSLRGRHPFPPEYEHDIVGVAA